ncbi:MAG: hypothetical protein N2505_06435 [Endomicrobia bacterium]|nr:hypothetical protein [Endomicrobiia bacterium]
MTKKLLILILLFYSIALTNDEIKSIIYKQNNLNEEQKNSIINYAMYCIDFEKIPENLILLRIKELIAKKANYLLIYTTLIIKASRYKVAKIIIDEYYQKLSKKDIEYAIQYISDQIEKGVSLFPLIQTIKTSAIYNLNIYECLKFVSLLTFAKENKIDQDTSLEIILSGIATKKSFQLIKETIIKSKNEMFEKEIIKEKKEKEIIEHQ